jgi:hypothetical protein
VATSFAGPPSSTEADFAKHAPYQWNYYAPIDLIQRNMAEVICKQLNGKPASFAAGAEALKPRKFGMIIDATVKGATPVRAEPLLSLTRRCGAVWDVHEVAFKDPSVPNSAVDGTKNPITQMQGNDVTTIVCLCIYSHLRGAMQNANVASPPYAPEWFVQDFGIQDVDHFGTHYPAPQDAQVFGLRTWNKSLPREQMPYWNARLEVDATTPEDAYNFDTDYWNLLVLASGIQLAGPNLTPSTFEQGLHRARFPNPNCGRAPYYQACVGFEGGTHTMIKDFALVWWNPNETSFEYDRTRGDNRYSSRQGLGAFCYAELGVRRSLGRWPEGDPALFGLNACR